MWILLTLIVYSGGPAYQNAFFGYASKAECQNVGQQMQAIEPRITFTCIKE
jgi:hypothetical protein